MALRLTLAAAFVLLAVGCAGSSSGDDPSSDQSSAAAGAIEPAHASEPTDASEEATEQAPAEEPEREPAVEENDEALRAQDPAELEQVVRAWSEALNSGDDQAAAELFAAEALVIQGDLAIALRSFEDAVEFNDGLPCSGQIVRLSTESPVVTAVFELGDRPDSVCDVEPGTLAAAQFLFENGKIVIWRQIPVPGEDGRQLPSIESPKA